MSDSQHQVIKTRYRGHEILCRAYRNWYEDGRPLYVISVSGTGGAVWAKNPDMTRALQSAIDGVNAYAFNHYWLYN